MLQGKKPHRFFSSPPIFGTVCKMMSSKHEPPCLDSRRIYLMKVDQSLEETMSKMVNLVTLYISLQTDCALEHFKFYRPALNGLRFCQNLKEFILHFDGRVNDDPDWEEYVFTTAIYYGQLLRITLWPNMTYFWICQ